MMNNQNIDKMRNYISIPYSKNERMELITEILKKNKIDFTIVQQTVIY